MSSTSFRAPVGALALILLASCSSAASPSGGVLAAVASLPGGTPVAVDLAAPAEGALVATPPGVVHVSGTVSIGEGERRLDTALVYVVDASTAAGGPATCGAATTLLACELGAVSALNARAVTLGTVGDVGAAIFAGGGAPLDVAPADGAQLLAAPGADANGAGGPDGLEALGTVTAGGAAAKFTPVSLDAGPTQVGSGLAAGFTVAAASARPSRLVVLLSASTSAAGPGPADLVVPAEVVVRAFALPGTTCAAGLGAFADRGAAGSGCEDVADLTTLAARVAAVLDATLTELTLSVDGGPGLPLVAEELPAASPWQATFQGTVSDLAPGIHRLCVRATGTDAGGAGFAEVCVSVQAAAISLSPAEAAYELGTPGQTATVTATVAAGEAGGVADVPVTFTVQAGPNAGKGATVVTDADGRAAFTYQALQHLEGLGTDAVEACFADAEGTTACASAAVTWQDTTPPVVACLPGPNPAGKIVSRQGGLSPSGFMRLVAEDAVDPAPQVSLLDAGSSAVWGPFVSGQPVKYTQAPGATPSSKEMGPGSGEAPALLHLKGRGDPAVRGLDAAGNESLPLVCPVPP